MKPLLQVRDLIVRKQDRVICRVPELNLSAGERLVVVGANGSGKTTLLRVLAGLETDYSGDCFVSAKRRQRVFVHQTPFLFRGGLLSNLAYGLAAHRTPRPQRRQRIQEQLHRWGLTDLAERRVERLSGGERRRAALARACILRPALLLLDEPLSDLDELGVECVRRMLEDSPETTVVMTSPQPLGTLAIPHMLRIETA